ncbi:MAG: enoyl-CoA hydratase-related protein [Acidimicrobiales bacterium]|jgi:enoyl-CoA hydratase/carnithine racemase|nr:enoyl-CoA hydratase-related protein [Acidimicrobiales bacterium]
MDDDQQRDHDGHATVRTEVHDRVLVVHLDREHKRNAVDPEMTAGIDAALNRLEDDPELWAGVITGTATVFSAGTDLRAGMSASERGGQYGVIRRRRTTPLLAAVEGPALGGGMEIVLACDLVVASTTARFGLPEVQRSLVPVCAGVFRSVRTLPLNVAREILLTGDPIDAERAERLGFVARVTAPGRACAEAVALAERICRNGPVAIRETMRILDGLHEGPDEVGWALTERAEAVIRASDDTVEGVTAFFERREPRWSGR